MEYHLTRREEQASAVQRVIRGWREERRAGKRGDYYVRTYTLDCGHRPEYVCGSPLAMLGHTIYCPDCTRARMAGLQVEA